MVVLIFCCIFPNISGQVLFSGYCVHLFGICLAFPQPNLSPIEEISILLDKIPNMYGADSQDRHIHPNRAFWATLPAGCPQKRCPLPSDYGSMEWMYKQDYSLQIGLLEPRWGPWRNMIASSVDS